MEIPNFSVLMSVYNGEKPNWLDESLKSILNQTFLPNQIVIVKDGPLNNNLEEVLNSFLKNCPFEIKIIPLEKNYGLGYALSVGLTNCKNEFIARMDSDDICVFNRFERQLKLIIEGGFDIVGANIEEFSIYPGDLQVYRKLPPTHLDIFKLSKYRNPFNHPTVMFRKSIVLNSGNYKADYLYFEDWHLFVRMIRHGAQVYNIQENLLFFRVNNKLDVIKRRSGIKYFYYEFKFSKFLLQTKHINIFEWFFYVFTKLPLRLLPPYILKFIYYKVARR